ncbi:MAG: hypothetical protein NTY88_10465 [Bacteroidetes bacterium]|nr:hypothetical protein [Bacteroidota bacterium]
MKWKAEPITHKNEARIALHFDYSKEANQRVRKLTGVQWSKTLQVWHLPDNEVYRKQFKLVSEIQPVTTLITGLLQNETPAPLRQKPLARPLKEPLNAEGLAKIDEFKRWLRSRRYSDITIKTYSEALLSFLKFYRLPILSFLCEYPS